MPVTSYFAKPAESELTNPKNREWGTGLCTEYQHGSESPMWRRYFPVDIPTPNYLILMTVTFSPKNTWGVLADRWDESINYLGCVSNNRKNIALDR